MLTNLRNFWSHTPTTLLSSQSVGGFVMDFGLLVLILILGFTLILMMHPCQLHSTENMQILCWTSVKLRFKRNTFSYPFRFSLLPGMYCMPVHAVPKPCLDDLCLITDHSSSNFSLNSMISRNDHPTYSLDNLHLLGKMLILACCNGNASNLIMLKSDIAEVYRLMSMHPFLQVKQVVQVVGLLHVNMCGVFGGCKSGDYSVSFYVLVTWIACDIKGISDLSVYSDDFYRANDATDFTFYPPYNWHLQYILTQLFPYMLFLSHLIFLSSYLLISDSSDSRIISYWRISEGYSIGW